MVCVQDDEVVVLLGGLTDTETELKALVEKLDAVVKNSEKVATDFTAITNTMGKLQTLENELGYEPARMDTLDKFTEFAQAQKTYASHFKQHLLATYRQELADTIAFNEAVVRRQTMKKDWDKVQARITKREANPTLSQKDQLKQTQVSVSLC